MVFLLLLSVPLLIVVFAEVLLWLLLLLIRLRGTIIILEIFSGFRPLGQRDRVFLAGHGTELSRSCLVHGLLDLHFLIQIIREVQEIIIKYSTRHIKVILELGGLSSLRVEVSTFVNFSLMIEAKSD